MLLTGGKMGEWDEEINGIGWERFLYIYIYISSSFSSTRIVLRMMGVWIPSIAH